jgi:hypothetical protein
MTLRPRSFVLAVIVAGLVAWLTAPLLARSPAGPPLVDPEVLESLLPAPEGWTVARRQNKQVLNPEYTHAFAEAVFTKGEMTVRLTIADTGANEGSLMALATMIMTLPEGFVGEVPPATTIRRLTIDGMPAAERWSAADLDGEFSVLINKRFVVAADGRKLDAVGTLRGIVGKVDLKRIAALN